MPQISITCWLYRLEVVLQGCLEVFLCSAHKHLRASFLMERNMCHDLAGHRVLRYEMVSTTLDKVTVLFNEPYEFV